MTFLCPYRQILPFNEAKLIKIGYTATPIFFTHDGVGDLMNISSLAEHIATDNSVYGLPPIPLDDFHRESMKQGGLYARLYAMQFCNGDEDTRPTAVDQVNCRPRLQR